MRYRYVNELITLYSLFEFSKNLLTRIRLANSATWCQKAAFLVFRQALESVGVVLSYLPDSPIQSQFKSFSPSILASQGRIMVDNFITISYLLEKKTPEQMSNLQELIWNQGIDFDRQRIVQQFNPQSSELKKLARQIKNRDRKIRNHPLFNTLDKKMQNKCAKGQNDKIYTPNEIIERNGIKSDLFWPTHNHFSQFVHSTAFATDQLVGFERDAEQSLHFIRILVTEFISLFSLTILWFSDGFGVSKEEIPLGILHTLLYWWDFFQGKYEERTEHMNKKSIPLKRANRLINHGCTILVTSRHGDKESIITLAWQMPVSASPPMAAISVGPSRYSHDLISQSGQFVINVPPFSLLKETIHCGSVSGRDEDKFEGASLTREPAQIVSAPLIAECIGHLECQVIQQVSAGDHTLFVGQVAAASAAEDLFEEVWQVEDERAKTIHHLGGSFFAAPEKIVHL